MDALLALLAATTKLKQTKRAGWVQRSVPAPESVADHSYRVAFLAMLLASERNVNPTKAIQMALLHDLAESVTGDLTPMDKVDPTTKHRDEGAAMHELLDALPNGKDYLSLWQEFEENKTPEAQLVHDLDILERVVQAAEYQAQHGIDLSMFFVEVDRLIRDPVLQNLAKQAIVKNGEAPPKQS